jgi:hypothetical protein
MDVFLATLVIFGLALLAMAVGVLAGRSPIQGSCGGIGGRCEGDGGPSCDLCRPESAAGVSKAT